MTGHMSEGHTATANTSTLVPRRLGLVEQVDDVLVQSEGTGIGEERAGCVQVATIRNVEEATVPHAKLGGVDTQQVETLGAHEHSHAVLSRRPQHRIQPPRVLEVVATQLLKRGHGSSEWCEDKQSDAVGLAHPH